MNKQQISRASAAQHLDRTKPSLQLHLVHEKEKLARRKQIHENLLSQQAKLDEGLDKIKDKLNKYNLKLNETKSHLGDVNYFLQQNPQLNYYLEQFAIQNSQRETGEPDTDRMSYEELLELGDKLGKVSKGLTADEFKKLRVVSYGKQHVSEKGCTICCEEYQMKETVTELNCGHLFHQECIGTWLKNQDQCPLCKEYVVPR